MNDIEVNIENYELLKLRSIDNKDIKMSRLVVYIRKDVNYKRRLDLENKNDSALWLDIKMKGGRKVICGNLYREFMYSRQRDNS